MHGCIPVNLPNPFNKQDTCGGYSLGWLNERTASQTKWRQVFRDCSLPEKKLFCEVKSCGQGLLIKKKVLEDLKRTTSVYIQGAFMRALNPPGSSRGWSKVLEKRRSATSRGGHEPSEEKVGLQNTELENTTRVHKGHKIVSMWAGNGFS